MAHDFYTLEEMAPRFGVDANVFIKAWLEGRLPLYIYFGNESRPCTIKRCVSAKENEHVMHDILYGRDFYQSKASPDNDVLMFVPETPLSAHLKVKAQYEFGGGNMPERGKYYEYMYQGNARGYWLAKPTNVAHLSRGKYLLTDKESFEYKKLFLGDVMVHAHEEYDYLIFSENTYVEKSSLMIREDDIKTNLPELKKASVHVIDNEITTEESGIVNSLKEYPTPKIKFALCLMIHILAPKRSDNTPIITKITSDFNLLWDEGFSESTVNSWAKKPDLQSKKRLRPSFAQETGIYILLSTYCALEDIKKNASIVATRLTELVTSTSLNLGVKFSAEDVTPWLKRPPKRRSSKSN
ncbi:hypothetical protein BF17_04500 [Yersinia similis]|uniref:Uncharacterized protein n=1 Tax=Yersinia similis TaxID=367190 RepID=A0ABM5Q444_9GAMM|nr:hypothetical protein [Yersinia similis]AHK21926.1 hypothetical protein BF17_04500 [Yersinia similis]CFQ68661.1 HNH endonuclease domain-containing protein [Yersinia similis]